MFTPNNKGFCNHLSSSELQNPKAPRVGLYQYNHIVPQLQFVVSFNNFSCYYSLYLYNHVVTVNVLFTLMFTRQSETGKTYGFHKSSSSY